MAMKKLLVGCLIISVLIGTTGAVLANSVEQSVPAINTENVAAEIGTVAGNVVYSTHVQNVGWQEAVSDGDMSGTEGKALRLEGITIGSGIDGVGISYATHVQNIGWQDAVVDGEVSGTEGKGLRLEGIRINLTGEKADQYDVVYRVHAQNVGWMGYALNGADAGTAGYGYRLEGIEIQIVQKGTFTGDTENAFKDAADTMKLLYLDALQAVKDGESAYRATLPKWKQDAKILYRYTLCDIEKDGVSELIVSKSIDGDGPCDFYKITADKKSVHLLNKSDYILLNARADLSVPKDGNGVYVVSFEAYRPEIYARKFVIYNDTLVKTVYETYINGDVSYKAFVAGNTAVEWFDIDDTKPLL